MEHNVTVVHNESGNSFSFLADDWHEESWETVIFFLGIEIVGRFPKDKFSFCRDKSNELKQFQGLEKLTEQQKEVLENAMNEHHKKQEQEKSVVFEVTENNIKGLTPSQKEFFFT